MMTRSRLAGIVAFAISVSGFVVPTFLLGTPATASGAHFSGLRTGIVEDGTFKNPHVKSGFKDYCASPNPDCPVTNPQAGPWVVTSGSVDFNSHRYWQPAPGAHRKDQTIDLNGLGPGTFEQSLATTAGTSYSVSFYLAGNGLVPPAIKTMDVDINGTPVESYTFDTTHTSYSDMGWVPESFTFTATSASTSLSFVSTTPDSDGGPVIADVGAFAAG